MPIEHFNFGEELSRVLAIQKLKYIIRTCSGSKARQARRKLDKILNNKK